MELVLSPVSISSSRSSQKTSTLLARRSAHKSAPALFEIDQDNRISGLPMATTVATTTTLHESSPLPSAMNITLAPSFTALGSSSRTSTTSLPLHASPTLNSRRPSPRKASTYPGPPVSGSTSGSLRFSPLTPILASPSLSPDPGSESREDVDVGAVVQGSDMLGHNDYLGAKEAILENGQSKADGAPVAGSSGGNHEANSILYVASEGLHAAGGKDDVNVVDRSHEQAGPPSQSDAQDQCIIPRTTLHLRLPPTAPNSAGATPMWTSTPPTPPQIPEPVLDPVSPTDCGSPSGSYVDAGHARRKRRLSQPRPASVSVFLPQLPTSAPRSALLSSVTRSRTTIHRTLSSSMSRGPKRRQSLPPNFGKPLPPLPTTALCSVTASPSREAGATVHSRLPSSSSSSSSSQSPSSHSRSHSSTRKGLDLDRLDSDDGVMLPPSLSRNPDKLQGRTASGSTIKVRDPREVKSEGGCVSPLNPSDSMRSFQAARSSFSAPTSPVRSPHVNKVFSLEGSVSECDEGEEEYERGRKAERELAANAEEAKGLKRFHALVELLKTEVGYLMDLRVLVSIYLAQLPHFTVSVPSLSASRASPSSISISTLGLTRSFPSSRSSFIAAPQASCSFSGVGPPIMGADIYQGPTARSDTDAPRDTGKLYPDSARDAKKAQDSRRVLLSESDVQLVIRNAEELLGLHERIVVELRLAVAPFGYDAIFATLDDDAPVGQEHEVEYWATATNVDDAVNAAASVFARQSSSFGIYEQFCPRHNEAADIIRSAQDQYHVEWDAFERRCSLLIASAFEFRISRPLRKSMEDADTEDPSTPESVKRHRRHSTPILTSATSATLSSSLTPGANATELPETRKRKRSGGNRTLTHMPSQLGRLKFVDYMIKPVQRICKYPLLLDQLKYASSGDALIAVERACVAMRSVVGLVDMASMRQAHSVKSALIVSRIAPSLPMQPPRSASPPSPSDERLGSLTADFLSSLGACLLAGALDIVQHPSTRARYLGSFLYVGGYMVMVKITKGGKVYEPKYWFSLAGFELVDDEDEDVALPYSFHLCRHGHFLQFAAACHLEKEIWMTAIRDAMSTAPEWKDEPQPSLPDAIVSTSPGEEEQHHEFTVTPLPTILSLSELEGNDPVVSPSAMKSQSRPYKTMPRMDASVLRHGSQTSDTALSRRSSTASVKAFFSPLSFDISSRITRPSSQVRQQVDHGLHDVFSDNCLTVRTQALMREEELFQIRKKSSTAMSRSNSGLSLTSAMKRRYDSVLVSSRRRSSMDGNGIEPVSDPENNKNAPVTVSRRSKTVGIKRRHLPSLSLVPSEGPVLAEVDTPALSPDVLPDSPTPLSNCSSATSSNIGSMIPSPLDGSVPLPLSVPGFHPRSETLHTRSNDYRPKRTRSMVDNVRYFFHSRSLSPTPPSTGHPSPRSAVNVMEPDSSGLAHWWRRGSLRRRAQSSPDAPSDDSPCPIPDNQHASREDSIRPSYSIRPPDTGESQATLPPTPRRVAFKDSMHHRRRSSYVPTRSDVKPPLRSDSVPSTPRKTLKSVLFFRSTSFTPLDSR